MTVNRPVSSFQWLFEKNVLACPVCSSDGDHQVVGLVDMVDLCSYTLLHSPEGKPDAEAALQGVDTESVINYSGQNNLIVLPGSAKFSEVIRALGRPGVHRVCIKNYEKSILSKWLDNDDGVDLWLKQFVTQSLVLEHISKNPNQFGDLLKISVATSGVGSKSVYSCSVDDTVYTAFKLVVHKKVSGIAVLDKDNKFVGNLAARDLCGIMMRKTDMNSKVGDVLQPVTNQTCSETATIQEVVALLQSNHIHRVYVLDREKKPTSVVGLRDLFSWLSKFTAQKSKLEQKQFSAEKKLNKEYTYKMSRPYNHYVRTTSEIVAVDPSTSAYDAFQMLCSGGFSSLPVLEKHRSLLGLVDMADFTVYMIERFSAQLPPVDPSFDVTLKKELAAMGVSKLMNYSKINSCYPQKMDVKLRDIFRALSRPGVHRLPLVNAFADKFNRQYVEGFVAQSEAIRFVADHTTLFGSRVLHRKIADIPDLGSCSVVSISEKSTALDAFKTLHLNNISGMPIVDDQGRPVAR